MSQDNITLTITDEFAEKIRRERMNAKLTKWAPVLVLLLLILIFSVTCRKSFATASNFLAILNQLAMPLLIALGLTFVIMIGSIDLSVDGVVGMCGSIVTVLVMNSKNANHLGLLGIAIAISIGVVSGIIIGMIHVKAKVPSFMVSFGMSSIAAGIGILSYGGLPATIEDPVLKAIPNMSFIGVPVITWISVIIFIIAYIIQERTAFGRYIYAIGSNENIPRMSGVNIDRVKILVFVWSGLCLSIAGVLGAMRLGRGEVAIGKGSMFPAQAAVVVGGTALAGGSGGVVNTLVGSMIITVLNNGLILLGVNSYIRTGVQGIIILIAVALTVSRSKDTINK
ncbi:MAG: branched-chain amino acid transporter permease [Clostridia bacterium]|jgi:ribose transport system permease protein|nr:branched-chain amino acid transporter permease [Clostridia bacterium]